MRSLFVVATAAIVALTFLPLQANATPPCDPGSNACCNVAPLFLYCAFDNHLLSDPTEPLFNALGQASGVATPSSLAGCSALERQLYSLNTQGNPAGQIVKGAGGCLAIPSGRDHAWYHTVIAAAAGADDNPAWVAMRSAELADAQVCFYSGSLTVLACHSAFFPDDIAGGADDSMRQLIYRQCIPAGARYFDIEAFAGSATVIAAFWQDAGYANATTQAPTLCDGSYP